MKKLALTTLITSLMCSTTFADQPDHAHGVNKEKNNGAIHKSGRAGDSGTELFSIGDDSKGYQEFVESADLNPYDAAFEFASKGAEYDQMNMSATSSVPPECTFAEQPSVWMQAFTEYNTEWYGYYAKADLKMDVSTYWGGRAGPCTYFPVKVHSLYMKGKTMSPINILYPPVARIEELAYNTSSLHGFNVDRVTGTVVKGGLPIPGTQPVCGAYAEYTAQLTGTAGMEFPDEYSTSTNRWTMKRILGCYGNNYY